ncbi:uncharacterized protein [Palaemon carinicauda]|uniref:uncharacterized protein n=1 Tax=Palaemon carinicauda TaxID=392227 RepID=UPI0035B65F7A
MDVSPSIRLDDHFKSTDLFDLVSCTEYDLSGTGIGTDWEALDDIVGRNVNNNNITVGDLSQSWFNGPYQDPPTPTPPPSTVHHTQDKEKETSDKMWGGGGTTEKVVNSATGNTIIITFPPTDAAHSVPDTSDAVHNPSPPMTEHNNLDLFNSILNEKPYDVMGSHNHRSPASDCVSYASACSGYSDSGISTSPEDTASPNGNGHHDTVDFDRLVDSAVDSLVYSPAAGGLGNVDEATGLEGSSTFLSNTSLSSYMTPVTQSNDVSSILEGALRGTVRRPGGPSQLPTQLTKVSESKTLTLMSNMTPLPPLTTAFKAEQLNGVAGSTQISSSNGMYVTTGYDYHPPPAEEFNSLDASFTKLSTATTTKGHGLSDSTKPKKRKYTKRQPGDEPTAKGRLLHFCHICNKGFKDKYSVNVHIRTHTGEKPFNCELCGKCFRQKAHLAKHVQIHTAPKPPGKR